MNFQEYKKQIEESENDYTQINLLLNKAIKDRGVASDLAGSDYNELCEIAKLQGFTFTANWNLIYR